MQFLGSSGYLQETCKRRLRNTILQKEKENKLIFSTFKNKIHAKKKQIIKVFVFINFTLEEDCTSIRLKHHGTPTNAAIQELTKSRVMQGTRLKQISKC